MGRSGFTLTEVLIAVTIVGILSATAVANYGSAVARSRYDTARAVLGNMYQGQRTYCAAPLNTGAGAVAPLGSEGTGFTGTITAACATAACRTQWNALGMENPNLISAGGGNGSITYAITASAGNCNTGTFTMLATVTGGGPTMSVNETFAFTCTAAWLTAGACARP